jgi:hypothetical protein
MKRGHDGYVGEQLLKKTMDAVPTIASVSALAERLRRMGCIGIGSIGRKATNVQQGIVSSAFGVGADGDNVVPVGERRHVSFIRYDDSLYFLDDEVCM